MSETLNICKQDNDDHNNYDRTSEKMMGANLSSTTRIHANDLPITLLSIYKRTFLKTNTNVIILNKQNYCGCIAGKYLYMPDKKYSKK